MTLRPSRKYRRDGCKMGGLCLRCGCHPQPKRDKYDGKHCPGRPCVGDTGRCQRCIDDRNQRNQGRKRSGKKAKNRVAKDAPF